MQSFSSDVDGEYVAVQDGTDAVSVLISGLTSMDITPREERKVGSVSESAFAANAKPGEEHKDADASGFLLVRIFRWFIPTDRSLLTICADGSVMFP